MNAPYWDGRHGAPKPPKDLWDELEAAGHAAGTDFESDPRYMVARAKFQAWLIDQGYEPGDAHGTERPDGAVS